MRISNMAKNRQRTRRSLRKLPRDQRKKNATRWLSQRPLPKNLLSAYANRYGVAPTEAHVDLLELGYRDEVAIQAYEQEGTEWEYKIEPLSGDMLVVPNGTPEWELHQNRC